MGKQEFKAESKRVLDLMINSIYTNKDIFLRELISNASDSIDKVYYKVLSDENLEFNKEDYKIFIKADKEKRQLSIIDKGIGMSKDELENNLGIIAKSGSLDFKDSTKLDQEHDIIGQFGVGFYSAFMVSSKVTVLSRAFGSDETYKWVSEGADGFEIEKMAENIQQGTQIILDIKKSDDDFNYDEYLEEYKLKSLVKKYSDFIRYPIVMEVTKSRKKEGSDEYEDYKEEEILNSRVPIWRKNKTELTDEDYENFYEEKHFGFSKPLKYIHLQADGLVRFNAIIYIPSNLPFNYYAKDYKKGLQLYSNGVLIMDKCAELLPDYYSFAVGVVDSEDLSLNISRETLQKSRQLSLIAKRIKDKITSELKTMLKNDRENYNKFYEIFSRSLKLGIYDSFGANKDELEDLLMFKSSAEEKFVTFEEYVSHLKEGQDKIYYVAGDSIDKLKKMPQLEYVSSKGYEVLYFTDEIDEFAIRILDNYKDKKFISVSDADFGSKEETTDEFKGEEEKSKDMLGEIKDILKDKVDDVKLSVRLVNSPVCLVSKGQLSVEMEKTLSNLPENNKIKAQKLLEINPKNKIFDKLEDLYKTDKDKFSTLVNVIYGQALIIEGLSPENPVKFADDITSLIS